MTKPYVIGAEQRVRASKVPCTASSLGRSVDTVLLESLSRCTDAFAGKKLIIASMRELSTPASSFLRWKSLVVNTHRLFPKRSPITNQQQLLLSRSLAQVRPEPPLEVWFTPSTPWRSPADDLLGSPGNGKDHKPPDERTLRLGKSTAPFLS